MHLERICAVASETATVIVSIYFPTVHSLPQRDRLVYLSG